MEEDVSVEPLKEWYSIANQDRQRSALRIQIARTGTRMIAC